jgi:hypothetical protein
MSAEKGWFIYETALDRKGVAGRKINEKPKQK